MRGLLLMISTLLCLGQISFAQVTGDFYPQWAREIESPSFMSGATGTPMKIAITSKDHIILGSEFLDSVALCDTFLAPSGSTDIFLTSVDTNGKLNWIVRGHATGYAWLKALAVDADDNIYVAAHSYDTLVLQNDTIMADDYACGVAAKFSPEGNLLWNNVYQGVTFSEAVATDPFGNVYYAFGYAQYMVIGNDTLSTGLSFPHHLGKALIKMDSSGNILWFKSFRGGLGAITYMECDEQGNVYFANYGDLVIDNYTSPGNDNDDTYLVKIEPNGQLAWVKSALDNGIEADQSLHDFTIDEEHVYWVGAIDGASLIDGDTVVTPEYGNDMIMIKYTKDGARKWIKLTGGKGGQGFGKIEYNPLDNKLYSEAGGPQMHVPGFDFHHPENRNTSMVMRFDTAGNFEQVYLYGGTVNGGDINIMGNGNFVDLIVFRDSVVVGNDTFVKPYDPVNVHGALVYFNNQWIPASVNSPKASDFGVIVYPNPATYVVTVSLTLPETNSIKIEMLDMLGRRVNAMVPGKKGAGNYRFQINTDHLAAGMYLIRISIGDKTITKKVQIQ